MAISGDQVRRGRMSKGLTQAQLAEAMGVSQAFVSGIETGRRAVSEAIQRELRRVLGTHLPEGDELAEIRDQAFDWKPSAPRLSLPLSLRSWERAQPSDRR